MDAEPDADVFISTDCISHEVQDPRPFTALAADSRALFPNLLQKVLCSHATPASLPRRRLSTEAAGVRHYLGCCWISTKCQVHMGLAE